MATKKNIKDVPQAGSAAVLLGANSENRWVKISGVAGGDLSGTLPSPTIRQNVALSGAPTAPTPAKSTDSTRIATTAYVKSNLADYATKADMTNLQSTANAAKESAELAKQTIDRMPYMDSVAVLSAIYTRDLQTVMVTPQSNPAPKSIFVKFTAEDSIDSTDRFYVCYLLISNVWGGTYTIYYNGSLTETYTIKVPAAAAGVRNTYIPVTLTFWVRKGGTDAYGYRAESMANATVTVDSNLSITSSNPVKNSVITQALNGKANLASPTFTGTPTAPTPSASVNNTIIATTAYVKNNLKNYPSKADVTESLHAGLTSSAVPYAIKLINVNTLQFNKPLEKGYEIALFRRSISRPHPSSGNRERGGYPNKGWKMVRSSKAGFDVDCSATLISKHSAQSPVYGMNLSEYDLIKAFATYNSKEKTITVHNNRYKYILKNNDKSGDAMAILKLGFAVIKKIPEPAGAGGWNGRYELVSNIAKFKLLLPRKFNHDYIADKHFPDSLKVAWIESL